MKKFILATILVPNLAMACPKPVQYLEQGQKAPCSGFLFSEEKEKELRKMKKEHELQKEQIHLLENKEKLYKETNQYLKQIAEKERKKAELWRKRAEESTKALVEIESSNKWENSLYLAAGVLLTVGAGYAIGAASK